MRRFAAILAGLAVLAVWHILLAHIPTTRVGQTTRAGQPLAATLVIAQEPPAPAPPAAISSAAVSVARAPRKVASKHLSALTTAAAAAPAVTAMAATPVSAAAAAAASTTAAPTATTTQLRTAAFPVMLLAHSRADRLAVTLASLLEVRGLNRSRVFVLQDGDDSGVRKAVRSAGLQLVPLPGGGDGGASSAAEHDKTGGRIARAYHRALTHAFDRLTDDEALLVVEDDLLFSPDLMEMMLAGFHVMQSDPSLWCVSAWNDNGFRGLVGEPKRLQRTGYFPGLGWLLTRRLYKAELEPRWPKEHWDHWMRSEKVHRTSRGRECLTPQVSRTFHHGSRGTFMTRELHARMFAHVAHSTDATVRWPPDEWAALGAQYSAGAYETRLRNVLREATPLSDLRVLLVRSQSATHGAGLAPPGGQPSATLALWYEHAPRSTSSTLFKEIAVFIGLWHEMRRAAHNGVHELWCGGARLLLVNTLTGPDAKKSPYADLAPPREAIFSTSDGFFRAVREAYEGFPQTDVCRDNTQPRGPSFRT